MKYLTRWDFVVGGLLVWYALGTGSTNTVVLCLIAAFIWLQVRPKPSKPVIEPKGIVAKTVAAMSAPLASSEEELQDDNEFVVSDEGESHAVIALDVDIKYKPCPGHFRFRSRYDTSSHQAEYEYRVEGAKLFVRLLHQNDDGAGTPRGGNWEVQDGVVLETDIWSNWEREFACLATQKSWRESQVGKIAGLKEEVEWHELPITWLNGGVLFILRKRAQVAEFRKAVRTELQRIKDGTARMWVELDKIGLEPTTDNHYGLKPTESWDKVPREKLEAALQSLPACGITRNELFTKNRLIEMLQDALQGRP